MTRGNVHIALLRGINVGGKNKLPMKDLIAMFTDAGCCEVRSYIQSGNDTGVLHVAFLAHRPGAAVVAALDPNRSPPDEFVVRNWRTILKLLEVAGG